MKNIFKKLTCFSLAFLVLGCAGTSKASESSIDETSSSEESTSMPSSIPSSESSASTSSSSETKPYVESIPEIRFTSNVASEIDFATKATKGDLTRPEVEGKFTITNCDDSFKKTNMTGTMKVRGNQTANWSKKAFRIKLDGKTNLLGLNNGGKFKKWVLLADAKDTTLVRTALGLYVAKEILQAYDCIIRITNNYNPTTFEIEIPNSLFVADINNKESDKSKTILWIDDEINTSSLRPYLDEFGENGVSIVKVKNLDALNHIIDSVWSSLSVIILDIIMPPGENIGLNRAKGGLQTGLIVLENLLNDERLNNVPKIVFSNINVFEIKAFCKKNNIPILRKSDYASDEFIKKVDEIISDYR